MATCPECEAELVVRKDRCNVCGWRGSTTPTTGAFRHEAPGCRTEGCDGVPASAASLGLCDRCYDQRRVRTRVDELLEERMAEYRRRPDESREAWIARMRGACNAAAHRMNDRLRGPAGERRDERRGGGDRR